MTNPIDLSAIKRRLAEATPGPWRTEHKFGRPTVVKGRQRLPICETNTAPLGEANFRREEANAALIAASPADIAALVAEVERLRRVIEEALQPLEPRRPDPLTFHERLARLYTGDINWRPQLSRNPGEPRG